MDIMMQRIMMNYMKLIDLFNSYPTSRIAFQSIIHHGLMTNKLWVKLK